MLKRYFTIALLSTAFLTGGQAYAASGSDPASAAASVETVENVDPDAALPAVTETAPESVGDASESGIARKMTQAEKARNAKENDSWGGAITIIAMTIVIACLVVLSVLFLIFGKISQKLLSSKKRKNAPVAAEGQTPHTEDLDSGEVIAAISAALAEHFGVSHDMEDTILTIRRMKRAYSPWNSKIYNLRHEPGLHHNNPNGDALRHFPRR